MIFPSFAIHGGIRVALEWANRLSYRYEVHLHSLGGGRPTWFLVEPFVKFDESPSTRGFDMLIVTSPHGIRFAEAEDRPERTFVFLQMMEHLFLPNDSAWQDLCRRTYLVDVPLICISRWNIEILRTAFRRSGVIHYVGNGVNISHFPVERTKKEKLVLVEGWESYNPTKDSERIAQRVAERLRRKGYRIAAFSQLALKTGKNIPHEYYSRPDLRKMNILYSRAKILIKASKYDARACSPMEAMTKGTVTARAITLGDDDLQHEVNSLRSPYNEEALFQNCLRLLEDDDLYSRLSENCLEYARRNDWDVHIKRIFSILKKG